MELDSVYEEVINYHINDYIIFEATLRRDILEANGVLNEEDNRNFIQKMWDKLLELINAAKYKVISIVDGFINKSYDKKLEKYKKMVEDNKELLNKTNFDKFTCDFKTINWSKINKDGDNEFEELCDHSLAQFKWSINELRTRNVDDIIKNRTNSVKNAKDKSNAYYDEYIVDHKDHRLEEGWTKPENLIKDLDVAIKNLETYKEYKLEILKHFEKLQREVTQLKRNSKNDDEEMKFANKAHKAFSIVLKDTMGDFNIINRLYTTDISGKIKLITSAISYAKEQNGSSSDDKGSQNVSSDNKKEDSQNSSYLYDIDYINAVTEAETYELSL